jgi:hypothetical protein
VRIFELLVRWYTLRIRIAWWGFWVLLGFRTLGWLMRGRDMVGSPMRWHEFWLFKHAAKWSQRRWNAVWEATRPGRWQGGTHHPTQKRLEPDPQLNPRRDRKWS